MNAILDDLKTYLTNKRPLQIAEFELTELGSGEYNINYLLQLPDRKLVIRVSVSQLSGNSSQLQHEYDVLAYLKGKQIAPEVYFIDMADFTYPLLIEEFIEGQPIKTFDHNTLAEIGSLIARLNNVPVAAPHPFEIRSIDYSRDIAAHEETYQSIAANQYSRAWFENTGALLKNTKALLSSKKPDARTMLIRRDANPNNFIMTDGGMRLVDWEITRVDDPTITLASFINEVQLYDLLNLQPTEDDMSIVKETFLKKCPIPDFEALLANRLIIEQLGGLVWALERFNNLLKISPNDSDYQRKLSWYTKVADRSYTALSASFDRL